MRTGLGYEGRDEQPRGIQRLQQIVAGSGEKARLARVGGLRLLLGDALRLERRAQLARTMRNPLLQALLGLEQGLLMALEFGDVRIGRDEAAGGHRLAVDVQHATVAARTLERIRGPRAQVRETLLDRTFRIALPQLAARRVPAQQIDHRPADTMPSGYPNSSK